MIFNYRDCTCSYLECKIRDVKKEEGYINQFMDSIINLRSEPEIIYIYLITTLILYYHFFIREGTFII